MNQQQLQIARAALWHQTAATDPSAPLLTLDAAAQWLDEMGLCLFLPRHTQLPAPAPSFVEACAGAASVTPPASAISQAFELATRLVAERRAIPLNLLGSFSEQPDFLITPDVLPWAAAVRGDRQWKSAPPGRTTPIVLRTWEALDREGEMTAVQIREALGRELTEAAVLRALIELWTNLRAMPIYASDQPTRWTLFKNRFATQLATAANTAQTTALSALLSIYLRSAVAATAEEAEIFLSPLTARSRIRDVIHGMMAARQFNTMSVASQTLLFVEGSLPETLPAPEPDQQAAPPETHVRAPRRPSALRSAQQPAPFRKQPRPTKWELPPQEATAQPSEGKTEWRKPPAAARAPKPAADYRAGEGKRFAGPRSKSGPHGNAKPWQRRTDKPFRPSTEKPFSREARPQARSGENFPKRDQPPRRSDSTERNRPFRPAGRPPFGEGRGPAARPPFRGERPAGQRPPGRFGRAGADRGPGRGPRRFGPPSRFPKTADSRPGASRPANSGETRTAQPGRPFRGERPAGNRPVGNRPPGGRFARPGADRGPGRGAGRGADRGAGRFGPPSRFPRTAGSRPGTSRPAPSGPGSSASSGPTRSANSGQTRSDNSGPTRVAKTDRPFRSERPRGDGPVGDRPARSGPARGPDRGPGRGPKRFGAPSRFAKTAGSRPGKSGSAPSRPFRPGKFSPGKPASASRGPRFNRPGAKPQNKFRKSPPTKSNPRKNRSQEENPE